MCKSFFTILFRSRLFILSAIGVLILSACSGSGGAPASVSEGGSTNVVPSTGSTNLNITAIMPADKATSVSLNLQQIMATFDKEIDPNSLNTGTFMVSNGITGTITTANSNTQAVFTPDIAFSRNTVYTVTLDGVTDTTGAPITTNNQQAYSWSFTTCGNISTSTYTVNWDPIVDVDLSGYKVYYGLTTPLNRANASSIALGKVTSWVLNPVDYGYLPCDNVQVSISSLGSTKSESNLSQSQQIIIE